MSSVASEIALKMYPHIKCDSDEVLQYVETQAKQNLLVAADLFVINAASRTVMIVKCEKKDCKYKASTATVYVTLAPESVAHEIHHAAQHASIPSVETGLMVMENSALKTAMEVSALATGINSGSTYFVAGSDALKREVQARFQAYDNVYGTTCVIAYQKLADNKYLASSRDRLTALGLTFP